MCTFKLSLPLQKFSLPLVASGGGWLEGWTHCDEQGPSLPLSLTWLWSAGGVLCWCSGFIPAVDGYVTVVIVLCLHLTLIKNLCDKRYFTDKETQATR